MDKKKEKTIGETLLDALDKQSEKYSDLFTSLFVYGPDILNKTISELRTMNDKTNKDESNN